MNADGSNPQRLSDFNAEDSDHIFGPHDFGPHDFGRKRVYATVVQTANWGTDDSYFFGDVETNLSTSDSVIVRAALTCRGS
jgi:hypothetical protein